MNGFDKVAKAVENYLDGRIEEEVERRVEEKVNQRMSQFSEEFQAAFSSTPVKKTESTGKKRGRKKKVKASEEIDERAQKVYSFLHEYRKAHDDEEATPTYAEMTDKLNMNSAQVRDALKELEEHQIIDRERKGRSQVIHFTKPQARA